MNSNMINARTRISRSSCADLHKTPSIVPSVRSGVAALRTALVRSAKDTASLQATPEVKVLPQAPTTSASNNVVPLKSNAPPTPPPKPIRNDLYAKWESLYKIPPSTQTFQARTEPSPESLQIWQTADAVCFDVDCTITINDGLDVLAEFMGVGPEIEAITNKAMDGTMGLEEALAERLNIINCTPTDVRAFLQKYPPETRLVPGIDKLIKTLMARGVHVYLISGGFRELLLPIAKHLGVPLDNVFANRMNWQWDDETGEPTKLVGFDMSEPTARNQGKPEAIARIREQFPYNNVVMIGDGITDLEAVQVSHGGADLFIGYGGVVQREAVMEGADWFVNHHDELTAALKRYKVTMVGGGAFACAVTHMMSQNTADPDPADMFHKDLTMWMHDREYEGRMLSEVINERHENPKYLPGVTLGENGTAVPNLGEAVRDADVLVFCVPHQYVHNVCKQLAGKVKKGAIAISLTKGMRVRSEGPQLISQMVNKMLGIDCSVLMGANIAEEIGNEQLGEAVIGYYNRSNAKLLQQLFDCKYFNVELIPDAVGAEMCGTLKNIVAVGVGMVEGLGLGNNTKAAIMRQGLAEMRKLSKALYPTVRDETFLESCGVADLIATCYGGRNRAVAMEWTKAKLAGTPKSFEQLEKELLNGQKLQGVLTSNEVQEILAMRGWEKDFPLFTTINRIITGRLAPDMLVNFKEGARIALPEVGSQEAQEEAQEAPKKKAPRKIPVW